MVFHVAPTPPLGALLFERNTPVGAGAPSQERLGLTLVCFQGGAVLEIPPHRPPRPPSPGLAWILAASGSAQVGWAWPGVPHRGPDPVASFPPLLLPTRARGLAGPIGPRCLGGQPVWRRGCWRKAGCPHSAHLFGRNKKNSLRSVPVCILGVSETRAEGARAGVIPRAA